MSRERTNKRTNKRSGFEEEVKKRKLYNNHEQHYSFIRSFVGEEKVITTGKFVN